MKNNLYYSYSEYLKETYQEKIYKLPINLPVSCPNRTGIKKGCFFCAAQGTGFEACSEILSVTEQLTCARKKIEKNIMHINSSHIFKIIQIHSFLLKHFVPILKKLHLFRIL